MRACPVPVRTRQQAQQAAQDAPRRTRTPSAILCIARARARPRECCMMLYTEYRRRTPCQQKTQGTGEDPKIGGGRRLSRLRLTPALGTGTYAFTYARCVHAHSRKSASHFAAGRCARREGLPRASRGGQRPLDVVSGAVITRLDNCHIAISPMLAGVCVIVIASYNSDYR